MKILLNQLEAAAKEATPGQSPLLKDMPFDIEVDCGNWCQGGTGYIQFDSGKRATYEDLMLMTLCSRETILALVDVARQAANFTEATYPDLNHIVEAVALAQSLETLRGLSDD